MFSIGSAILHFVIGGIAVALASIIADKVGGKLGGIIATMPASLSCGYYRISFGSSWYGN
ncbi:Permease [Staphylococcus aureus]|uniref:Permease n=1 Tax=Staphylococcus aureus TaxID=1280 RepID=A0A380DNF9_STAAU|nr:Permease [Staphylococcus aureus]